MIFNVIILLVALLAFIAYMVYAESCFKLAHEPFLSISKSFDVVSPRVFVSFLMFSAAVILINHFYLLGIFSSVYDYNIGAIGVFFLCGVPCFPCSGRKWVRNMHLVSAFIGFTCLVLSPGIDFGVWILTIFNIVLIVLAYVFARNDERVITIVEVVAITCLLINYLSLNIILSLC